MAYNTMAAPNDAVVFDQLLQALKSGRPGAVLQPDTLVPTIILGIRFLDAVSTMTGPEKQGILLAALQNLASLAPDKDAALVKAVVASPMTAAIIDSLCRAARGRLGIGPSSPWLWRFLCCA